MFPLIALKIILYWRSFRFPQFYFYYSIFGYVVQTGQTVGTDLCTSTIVYARNNYSSINSLWVWFSEILLFLTKSSLTKRCCENHTISFICPTMWGYTFVYKKRVCNFALIKGISNTNIIKDLLSFRYLTLKTCRVQPISFSFIQFYYSFRNTREACTWGIQAEEDY